MELKAYLLLILAVFVIFAYTAVMSGKRAAEKMKEKISAQWGKYSKRNYEQKEYDKIKYFYLKRTEDLEDKSCVVDDITWNDLDMDSVYKAMNTTWSSAGEEYLYSILRITEQDLDELKERDRLIEFFRKNRETSNKLQEIFYSMGRTKKVSMMEFIDRLNEIEGKSNMAHYAGDAALLASIALFAMTPVAGIIAFVCVLAYNIFTYYGKKAEAESYFVCLRYLVEMQEYAKKILNLNIKELSVYNEILEKNRRLLATTRRGAFLLSSGVNGSASEVIMEYVRMITHVDLIKFNNIIKTISENSGAISEMFCTLGKIDAAIAIASFRDSLEYYAVPEFVQECENTGVEFEDIYHPLIAEPVVNSLKENKCVLLTGSNASGKSTFLKTIAINSILAQTIYTCTAKKYRTCFYKIYSSMALRDNLMNRESYYMAEIKSLKRVIDSIKSGNKVLCFVDEVLRGTNTIERIAASSRILKYMAESGAMCFAATHDVELTFILEEYYSNYHFREEVEEDDILFNYKLHSGRAVSRNAIKLLKIVGYDSKIVSEAEKTAENFVNTGIWQKFIE